MKCFYDFDEIKNCLCCGLKLKVATECDNSCGSFECGNCNKEFFANYACDMTHKELEMTSKIKHQIIQTKKGFLIVFEGHNPECGEFD